MISETSWLNSVTVLRVENSIQKYVSEKLMLQKEKDKKILILMILISFERNIVNKQVYFQHDIRILNDY